MNTLSLLPNKTGKSRRPERVGELAVLPIFYKLKGKKVALAGGTDAAAWKAELLAASGAIVHIFAEELDEAFDDIIAVSPNSFVYHNRPWACDIFEGASIAIGDCESDCEAKAFYCAAKAAGVPVNVIDKPAFCEFQFGSIVNRSPAIVSISTDGAAPILGQAIRRRVETLLPKSLQGWAQLAADVRGRVNYRLRPGRERRAFWEKFVDRAFNAPIEQTSEISVLQDAERIAHTNKKEIGKVTLVGAGPGDAELLTLKAVRALQAADVILFDDLVSDDVLELARREAQRMLVGKRGGRTSCKQNDINDTMVKLAKAGKNVVRLKSGDPMIFGRAGEELKRLQDENIAVSAVPGITSASAMASALGVSLTHRDHAQSVRFVTGHSRKGELPTDINWRSIAGPKTTTIFYMGGRTASRIQEQLLRNDMEPTTPVVICSSVSRDNMENWNGNLSNLDQGIAEIGYDEPVLIGIGNAFKELQQHSQIDLRVEADNPQTPQPNLCR